VLVQPVDVPIRVPAEPVDVPIRVPAEPGMVVDATLSRRGMRLRNDRT
jgi:hypothetical protein